MQLKQFQPEIDVEQLDDSELVMAHTELHSYYRELRQDRKVEGWDMESLVQVHDEVRQQLEARDLPHQELNALDEESVKKVEASTEATGWVDEFIESDEKEDYVEQSPPKANWFLDAIELVQEIDESINLTNYVTLSATPVEKLEQWAQDWFEPLGVEQAIGCYLNDETEAGVALVKVEESDYPYHIVLGDEVVNQDNRVEQSYKHYQKLADSLAEGKSVDEAFDELIQAWVVPSNPGSYGLADPGTSWGDISKSKSSYFSEESGVSGDTQWSDADSEVRSAVTSYFSASASGTPADSFGDLWAPHHRPGGDAVRGGVIAAKGANSGARSEPSRPSSIKGRITSHLDAHLREFNDKFGDSAPLPDSVDQGSENYIQGHVIQDTETEEHRWYVWDQAEAERWLQDNGMDVPDPVQEGEFLSYQQAPESDFAELENEWRGPWYPPHSFVQGFDDRPVLLTTGKRDAQDTMAEVQAVKFQTQRPPELPKLSQMDVLDTDQDFYWYQWDQNEASVWLQKQDISSGTDGLNGNFYQHQVADPDEFDELKTVWEGKRSKPTDGELAGGEKPRRVTYGINQEGEREVQKIEFLVSPTFEQLSRAYVSRQGLTEEELMAQWEKGDEQ